MNVLFLLFLLGFITYLIVRRVSGVTRTPTWLLWLVAMTPAFIWSAWGLLKGTEKTMPSELVLIPFIVCLVLYWVLIQMGRVSPAVKSSSDGESGSEIDSNTAIARPETLTPSPLNKLEEGSLKNCFPWSVYYLQQIEYRPQAVICRGQLRSSPEVAYRTVCENIESAFGDRFYTIFQEGANGKPFFALVTNPHTQLSARVRQDDTRPVLAIFLAIITFYTTSLAWLQLSNRLNNFSFERISEGFPYAVVLLLILGVHELGHYFAARKYKVRATLPYFIPVLPLPLLPFGTFGAFTHLRSPLPNRKGLFDIGIAGPLISLCIGLPLLLWGFAHSQVLPVPEASAQFTLTRFFQTFDPHFSLLLSLLSKLALGSKLTGSTVLNLHPVAVASFLGLLVTAFNLMPVGQLDGGRITHAMFGQRRATMISQFVRIGLFLLSLKYFHLMVLAILLFLLPATDEATLNDVSELDDRRYFLGLLTLFFLVLLLLPTPTILNPLLGLQ
ncbi:MAG TPA: site-2 protease family protein [Leptolyngbyaceae cyanobacterium M33_DOE_097]|uniref:Site-2 protease family protein n=1 Tax=Oscillatoriales cyanobacterium SpSt-418 TaxID=2282169 RepID=A0A7C3KEL4_9CYAN|nr:site-2 protease family protein [Leptolyngbyaceae cyanobacterium M33_DOE_097]